MNDWGSQHNKPPLRATAGRFISVLAYPLIDPAAIPLMMNFCKNTYKMISGVTDNTSPGKSIVQSVMYCPTNV
jgi:hypothetical protein